MHNAHGASPVFFDKTARRARIVRAGAVVTAIGALALLAAFALSIVHTPKLAAIATAPARVLQKAPPPHGVKFAAARKALFQRIAVDEKRELAAHARMLSTKQIAGGYFAPWQDAALASFRAHAADLTHVYPAWLEIGADGRSIITSDFTNTRSAKPLLALAKANGVRVVPTISNASQAHFDPKRIALMLSTPENGKAVRDALVNFVMTNELAGLQLDIEMLNPGMEEKYEAWVAALASELHARGKELSATAAAEDDPAVIRAIARNADYVVAMAYDENAGNSDPGPVGSIGFVEKVLRRFTENVPADKLVLGLGVYGYDWEAGKEPQTVTNPEAMALASGFRGGEAAHDVIDYDADALEPTFQYNDDAGKQHEVWFLDAVTVANAMTLTNAYHVRGATLWALGMEDTSTWRVFGAHGAPGGDLHAVAPQNEPQFIGDGELLSVRSTPGGGARTYSVDPSTKLIADEHYEKYPSSWLITRRGQADHKIALTFDDGPDPKWTAQILDVLKAENVKATFFLIGQNAVTEPDLVRRIYREGNEIGNHSFTHPNMAHVGEERVNLELSATERAIESIIGVSPRLFRAPYNADADPSSYGEIFPVSIADKAGYITAGELIDPEDWDLSVDDPGGGSHRLTPDDIVNSVMRQLDSGNAVLLHDGGGDRSATLAAIKVLIPMLRAKGYSFVTMGELGGMSPAVTMPRLSPADRRIAALDDAIFTTQRIFGSVLFWAFSTAIALGLIRIALMLALAAKRTVRPPKPDGRARVDVMIAAYNEEGVITNTIKSVFASRDVDLHLFVVNDGSTDRTGEVIAEYAAREPRLTLINKPNGGKASALNLAIERATAPIIVGIDADTHVDRDALAALARKFTTPDIGAVAGNVQVGNADNIVTKWQAIEYITSQNIDRRGLARVNAVTVVPGAIGAWRVDALRQVGAFQSDTLAEDMDLTWRLRMAGWRIDNEQRAKAYTEAPADLGALMKQRMRWTFGTLQCLYKHRRAVFHYGWFGWLALPTLWLFQIVAQILAPFVDLQLLVALISRGSAWIATLQHDDVGRTSDNTIWLILAIYLAFLTLEFAAARVAFLLDRADAKMLWLQPLQRFVYRQIMYLVVWRALIRALVGAGQAWGKLRRTGAVRLAPDEGELAEGVSGAS